MMIYMLADDPNICCLDSAVYPYPEVHQQLERYRLLPQERYLLSVSCDTLSEKESAGVVLGLTRLVCMQGHDPEAAKFLIKPEDSLLSLTRLISQNDVVALRDIRRSSPPRTEATCFHTVLAGSGHLQVSQSVDLQCPFSALQLSCYHAHLCFPSHQCVPGSRRHSRVLPYLSARCFNF